MRHNLLTADRAAMQDCHERMLRVVESVRESSIATECVPELARLLRAIRHLLDRARDFWEARSAAAAPSKLYGSSGLVLPNPEQPTIAIEI